MKKLPLLFVSFAIVVLVLGYLLLPKGTEHPSKNSNPIVEVSTIRLEGVVTDSTNGCWIESGVCYIEIDHTWRMPIAYGLDTRVGMVGPFGKVTGVTGSRGDIGKRVEVYAKKVSETELTIHGSKEYYVRVVGE